MVLNTVNSLTYCIPLSIYELGLGGGMEKKVKQRIIGKPGENQATITEEKLNAHDDEAYRARQLLREAGSLIQPFNSRHIGSATIHYYASKEGLGDPQFNVKTHVSFTSEVTEGLADFGWKQLRKDLMESFGRNRGEERQT